MSLIQGGPGFPFLHQNVFLYLCTDVWSMLPIAAKCIPCTNIRDVIIKINSTNSDDALKEVVMEEEVIDCILEAGYTRSLSSVTQTEKNAIVSTITTYHLFLKVKAVMDQFKGGLEAGGVLRYLKKFYDLLTPLFVNENKLFTANTFKSMFTVDYADSGSILRHSEEQTYIYFADFLDECEEGNSQGCTLEDVCVFLSGASSMPPGGWPKKPSIEFIYDAILPTSSTCSLILRLPAVHKTYAAFKNALILGVKSNDGFGGP